MESDQQFVVSSREHRVHSRVALKLLVQQAVLPYVEEGMVVWGYE